MQSKLENVDKTATVPRLKHAWTAIVRTLVKDHILHAVQMQNATQALTELFVSVPQISLEMPTKNATNVGFIECKIRSKF